MVVLSFNRPSSHEKECHKLSICPLADNTAMFAAYLYPFPIVYIPSQLLAFLQNCEVLTASFF